MLPFINQPLHPLVLFVGILFRLFICAVFTTVGGILGAAFFGKPKARL
jgi:hypothetical protein